MFKSVHTKDYSNPLRNVYSTVILPPPSSSSLSPSPSSQTNTTTNLNLTPSTSILSTSSSSSSSSTTTTTTTQTDSLLNLSPGLTANLTSQDPLSHQTHSLHQFHLQSSELIMPNHQHSPTSKLMRPPQRPPACRMCKRRKSKVFFYFLFLFFSFSGCVCLSSSSSPTSSLLLDSFYIYIYIPFFLKHTHLAYYTHPFSTFFFYIPNQYPKHTFPNPFFIHHSAISNYHVVHVCYTTPSIHALTISLRSPENVNRTIIIDR